MSTDDVLISSDSRALDKPLQTTPTSSVSGPAVTDIKNMETAKSKVAEVVDLRSVQLTKVLDETAMDELDASLSEEAATHVDTDLGDGILEQQSDVCRLQADNRQLTSQVQQLRHEIHRLQQITAGSVSTASLCNSMQLELIQVNQELSRCKETLRAMKADRKRLKTEKTDLVGQMKQMYGTLKDKEAELRDFIRSYEQRNRDMLDNIKQLLSEKDELQRQLADANTKVRESTEQATALRAELELRNDAIGKLQVQLNKPSDVISGKNALPNTSMNESMRSKSSRDGDGIYSSSGEDLPPYQEIYLIGGQAGGSSPPALPRTASLSEGQNRSQQLTQRLRALSQRVPRTTLTPTKRIDRGSNNQLSSAEQDSNLDEPPRRHNSFTGTMSSGIYSSLSSADSHPAPPSRISFLTQRNYQAKLHSLDEAHELPVTEWKANHVLTWLELDMNMSSYGQACVDNIKSGKILLGLSDAELEAALRLESPLHRRKLRLAIEELRDPSIVQYRNASKIDHFWVAHDWLHSLGLAQFSAAFESQLVDARLVNVLSKKDLDKYLGVHRKFHQSSLLYGVQLLRMVNFDRQTLQERRTSSQDDGTNPLYWTNLRVRQWADRIDLQEYSDNLKESGVHGGVLVLDQSFTAEVLAAILGIPASKSYVRRHLVTELDAIVRPARAALESSKKAASSSRSALTRSYSSGAKSDSESSNPRGSGRKLGLRSSFGRAFGRKTPKEHPTLCPSPSLSKDSKLSSGESSSSVDLRQPRT